MIAVLEKPTIEGPIPRKPQQINIVACAVCNGRLEISVFSTHLLIRHLDAPRVTFDCINRTKGE